jgi:antitoxin component of MazEF toxin-antitoxin module
MIVQQQGKSLKVVVPQDVARAYDLRAGDTVDWIANQWGQLTLVKVVKGGKLTTTYNPLERKTPFLPPSSSGKA